MATTGLSFHLVPRHDGGRECGFSMIELLMAAFILAIGLLGLAALQVVSTRQGTTSRQLGTATFLAHNLLDQIQAEGAVSNGERTISANGTVTSNGRFLYIKPESVDVMSAPAAGPSYTFEGLLQTDPYYTVSTSPGYSATALPVFFSTSFKRNAGTIYPYAKTGIQEFTVNVTWREFNPQAPSNTQDNKFFSVSRYVRM